ncbi:MAG: efflux RND transporter permease subunit [Verrucomicrobiae bacterium]|nr:efflux RND transporter permease subunit [Verrucomicrobiae bacterium]
MHRVIEWFARNGVAANLLMVGILLTGGYLVMNKIVLREFPDYPGRYVTISMPYRGSTPAEVEESIVMRIEEAIFDVPGIKEMESTANEGSGRVQLEIEDGYDMGETLDMIKDRVDSITTFPEEAERPQVNMTFTNSVERLMAVVISGDLSERDLKHLGEVVREELVALPNITLVELKVARPYEVSIEVSETDLKRYGLTFDDIVTAVRRSSINLSAGSIKTTGGDILLRTSNQAYNYDDFAKIVVFTREDGTRLSLEDVATVNDGFDETPLIAGFNGRNCVVLDVFRTGDQNLIVLADEVKEYLKEAQARMPEGVKLDYWSDDSQRVKLSLGILSSSAIMGFALVIITLSLFLRPSLALWVSLGIPVAFAGSFIMLYLWDVSLNLSTLFAFILVLGIVVDDAIVTGENVFKHMQKGDSPMDSAIKGTQEVSIPVTFGVLTTIVAFYPLQAMTGWTGNNLKQISFVVIPVLLFSLVESKLILPSHLKHCKHIGRQNADRRRLNPLLKMQRFVADGLEKLVDRYYKPVLEFCLHHRYLTFTLFLSILAIVWSLMATNRIETSYYPRFATDQITIRLSMPAGTPFEVTNEHIRRMEHIALDYKKEVNDELGQEVIRNIIATAGGQPMYRSWGTRAVGVAELGEVVIELAPPEEHGENFDSGAATAELRRRIGDIPGAESLRMGFYRQDSGIYLRLTGPSFDDLREASQRLQDKLHEYEGLHEITDSFERAKSEFELTVKPEAKYLGITTNDLARQVRQAFFGAEAQRIQRGRDEVRVMVRYPLAQRQSLATLDSMMIRTPSGTEVPFSTVAEITPGQSLPAIHRVDRKRQLTVSASVDSDSIDIDGIVQELEDTFIYDLIDDYIGMDYVKSGNARQAEEDAANIRFNTFVVLIGVYLLLAIPFRSYVKPLVVMFVIPFGIVGAVLGHAIMDWILGFLFDESVTVNIYSRLGFLALSGVVVNDSLVLVHYINMRLKKGDELWEAIRKSGVHRFRPILLTSITTFAGLLPLMFNQSTQARTMIPMAISLGWGVLFATVITLILVPVNTLILDDLKRIFQAYWRWQTNSKVEPEGEVSAT